MLLAVPIATAAATYTYEKDGYVIEPQYDFHKQAPFLSVYKNKFWQKSSVKGHYAFKDETAMVEFGYAPNDTDLPVAKVGCATCSAARVCRLLLYWQLA